MGEVKGYLRKYIISILIVLISVSMFSGCTKESLNTNKDMDNRIDEYVEAFNKTVTDYQINGSILIAKDNNILINNSYGKGDYEKDIPITQDTVFRLCSITKLFTAVGIMQLYEKGQLDLKDPVSKYIPEQHRGNDITIHNLLTHTSGIESNSGVDITKFNTKEDIINKITKKPLLFEPGTDWNYSNSGFNLLAVIIEKVSGITYSDYMEKNIFKPANMKNTGCDSSRDEISNLAVGYEYENGKFYKKKDADLSFAFGAGEIYSTANDMYNFDKALHTGKLITKKTVEKIFRDNAGISKFGDNYGYGSTVSKLNGHTWYGHPGNLRSYTSYYIRFPEENTTIIILLNTWFPFNHQLRAAISAIAVGEEYTLPSVKKEVKLDEALLKKYEGKYESEVDTFIHLRTNKYIELKKDGNHLVDKQLPGTYLNFIPFSAAEFYMRGIEFIECKFEMDKYGKVISLVIRNSAEEVRFMKVE